MIQGQFGQVRNDSSEGGGIEFTELNLDYNNSGARPASAVSIDLNEIDAEATATGAAAVFDNANPGDVMKRAASADANAAPTGSGKLGAYFNFVNSVVGAGIIGLPFAIAQSGLWMGMVLLITIGYLTFVGVQTIIKCGTMAGVNSYEGLCRHALGKWGYWAVSWSMIIFPIGGMCAYLIIIGDNVPHVLRSATGIEISREVAVSVTGIGIILPLCFLRDMSTLAKSSSISVLAAVVIVLVIAFHGPSVLEHEILFKNRTAPEPDYSFVKPRFAAGLGTISFAYVCHHSSFIVFGSLKKSTLPEWTIVSLASIGTALVLSVIISLGGFLLFFNETESDILQSFGPDDDWMNFARLMLALTMVLTFPMEQFVARHSLHSLIWGNIPVTNTKHYVITLLLWGGCFIVGLTVTNLGVVLEITGATSASILGYILPGLCFFSLHPWKQEWAAVRAAWSSSSPEYVKSRSRRMRMAWRVIEQALMIVFGVLAFVVGTITTFTDA